jgi:hypothetical protein
MNNFLGATQGAIGTGFFNTSAIADSCGAGNAAFICDTLSLNGFTDWFLPSLNEFSKIYINRTTIGGFENDYYWTSCEMDNPSQAWAIAFNFGNLVPFFRTIQHRVRAARYF